MSKSYISISKDLFVWPHAAGGLGGPRIFHPHKEGRPKGMNKDYPWGWQVKPTYYGSGRWKCMKCHTIINSKEMKKALVIVNLAKLKG